MKQIKILQNEVYKDLGILYGLFFEDINHAADGGLYAELVQNRSFEYCELDRADYHALTAWEKAGELLWQVQSDTPLHENNRHYLHVDAKAGSSIYNLGYNTGIFVEAGKNYDFSIFAAGVSGRIGIRVSVETKDGDVCAEGFLEIGGTAWTKYEQSLKATKTTTCGRLVLTFEMDASCDLDMISLFPSDTFLGKKGGLRKDIAEALQEMHPKFLRFPGGCLVHDGSLHDKDRNSMYRWKQTLGKVEERPTWRNNWGYNQTLGIGYYEYFCFCEEIGAEPIPILPGAFNPHKGEGVPLEELDVWVQEALDLIDFANGDGSSKWSRIRKELGHEKSFELKYIGIGNEEVGDGFFERYAYFHRAIREKYPKIKIINTAGPFVTGESYEAGWASACKHQSDLVDEHYYSSPEWFLANMHHYEDYDENSPKVFLGEYASWGNTYYNALVEAAYMTHLERAKAVAMACYAPMLCNADYVNWKPDMLWFHNHAICKTPNYHVQKLFMEHQGTQEVRFETKNLDEVLSLADEPDITGKLTIAGNDIEGQLWDVRVTDCCTGEVTVLPDIQLGTDNRETLFMDIDSRHYRLFFRFQRNAGRKGLKIFFGKKDDKNWLQWEFGGWDNWDCNIVSQYAGRGSTISQRIFHVEEKEYFLELEVNGRNIKTWVNGMLYNDCTDRLPQLEELYIAASVEKQSDRTILKVVNLTGEAKDVQILLEGSSKRCVDVYYLQNYGLDETNTFENSERIVPQHEEMAVVRNTLEYRFEPHSLTIFSFGE